MRLPHGTLRNIANKLLQIAGSSEAESREVADHVVDACLKGHDSHGVIMVPRYIDNMRAGLLNANRHATLVRETAGFAVFDGDLGFRPGRRPRGDGLGDCACPRRGHGILYAA